MSLYSLLGLHHLLGGDGVNTQDKQRLEELRLLWEKGLVNGTQVSRWNNDEIEFLIHQLDLHIEIAERCFDDEGYDLQMAIDTLVSFKRHHINQGDCGCLKCQRWIIQNRGRL